MVVEYENLQDGQKLQSESLFTGFLQEQIKGEEVTLRTFLPPGNTVITQTRLLESTTRAAKTVISSSFPPASNIK